MKFRDIIESVMAIRMMSTALVFALILLAGCTTTSSFENLQDNESFSVDFEYKNLGAGASAVKDKIRLREGLESIKVSDALIQTLQGMNMSITQPNVNLGDEIPQSQSWKTDIVEIPMLSIVEHNLNSPPEELPLNRIYAVQYVGSYLVKEEVIRFKLQTFLFHKGSGNSSFKKSKRDDYSSTYFLNQFKKVFEAKLLDISL